MTTTSANLKSTAPFIAILGLAYHVMAQGTIGAGGPLPEGDGQSIYRVPPMSMAFDRDVSSNVEIAEDLYFAGINRVLTDLTFNYKANYAQVGGIVVTVYAEGGPDANGLFLPGAKLLEKPVNVQVGSSLANVALAYSAANTVPDRVIVSIRFVDIPAGGSISLVAQPSAPEVGSTRPGYLERTGPGDQDWALRPLVDTSGNQVNFLLGVKAAAVPEASTVALGLAGVGILMLAGRRRRP